MTVPCPALLDTDVGIDFDDAIAIALILASLAAGADTLCCYRRDPEGCGARRIGCLSSDRAVLLHDTPRNRGRVAETD
jgi:hypothetical protein